MNAPNSCPDMQLEDAGLRGLTEGIVAVAYITGSLVSLVSLRLSEGKARLSFVSRKSSRCSNSNSGRRDSCLGFQAVKFSDQTKWNERN